VCGGAFACAVGHAGDPAFGCPETRKPHPEENFSCQDRIYKSLLAQTLANPVGSVYVYSDLRSLAFIPLCRWWPLKLK
jgi:hypothetical protein